jgi:N-formylglutamate amidohydrolase
MTTAQPHPYHFFEGTTPLLISIPHVGTDLPTEVEAGLSDAARPLPDTDWHLTRLYDFAGALGASVLGARYSRFTIDLNRPRRPSNRAPRPARNSAPFIFPRSGVRTTRRSATN